jgi:LmbE family N-acetylglucosaminyl deacetylase
MAELLLHVYLSPHLDDAILSCGGLIHRQRMSNAPVMVITLCAGAPEDGCLSPFAQEYHAAWGDAQNPVTLRQVEDLTVLGMWGVMAHHSNMPDSVYRRAGNEIAYPDVTALFAEPHPHELDTLPKLWHQELGDMLSYPAKAIIYAPLAAGNHVDHQLGRALALRLINEDWQVWFYEDFPHIESPGALQKAQAWFGLVSWQAKAIPIDVKAKIEAIRGYQTQIPFIFGDEHTMIRRVKRFTAETACDISLRERLRRRLVGLDGRRERIWRAMLGYHAHAERVWRPV